ncbi:septin-5-like isoform X2, partial [Clarias magur]
APNFSTKDPEDAELVYAMIDLPPTAGHTFPSREADMIDPDGRTLPHSPGTPTFTRRNQQGSRPDLLHRCHFTSTSSLEAPLSRSQSKSPWRQDPYDFPE